MIVKNRILLSLLSVVMIAACAASTAYRPALDTRYGYSEQQIETDRWKVQFAGNSLTKRQTVELYLLYRLAELTDQNGFDFFKVVTRETDEQKRTVPVGTPFSYNYRLYARTGLIYAAPYRFCRACYDPFWHHEPETRDIIRYEADAEIIMGYGPAPEGEEYFDAEDVLMNLAGQITLPEPAL
ncbi:MAG: CC0125/CC1285 family lipoprotein [Henriciella sp.]